MVTDTQPEDSVEAGSDSVFWSGIRRNLRAGGFTDAQVEELIDMVYRVVTHEVRQEADRGWDRLSERLSDRVSHDVLKKLYSEGRTRYQWVIGLLIAVASSAITLLLTLLYLQP